MQKLKENKSLCLLFFLALFGLSVGVFDNYRELWMNDNGLSTSAISHVISISYIVTVFILFYFTIRVSPKKLKWGISLSLLINMITGTILICLNHTKYYFWIKFLMFFDIAFSQLILASVYPLMMQIDKSDELYAQKSFVETVSNKFGFLIVAFFLGKTIFHHLIDYNICLLVSVIFNFLAFISLLFISLNSQKDEILNIKQTKQYFAENKVLYHFLITNLLGDMIWGCVLGMPLLLLVNNFHFTSNIASFIVLGLGILSSILSILILKYFRFENDNINLFIKFGLRIILYFLIFLTNNSYILLITIFYLFLLDQPYSFIYSSYFINHIKEEYSLFLTTLRYGSSLLGKAMGTMICGFVFHLSNRLFILPALIISIIHYILATLLIQKKEQF